MSESHEPVRQFLKSVRDANGVSLRDAACRMPRGRMLSRTSLGDRLSGKHPIRDVGELDALVVAFGGSREDRACARMLYRSAQARTAPRSTPASDPRSVPKDRNLIRALLDDLLPASQLTAGNGDMLAEVAVDELDPGERLHLLYPCRAARSAGGSAVLMVTDRDVVLVELVGNGVAGSRQRRPRSTVRQVPLEPRRSLHLRKAHVTIRWEDGTEWRCRGLRRDQAMAIADLLRPDAGGLHHGGAAPAPRRGARRTSGG